MSGTTPVPSQLVPVDGIADAGFREEGAHVAADVHRGDVIGGARRPLPDQPCQALTLEVVGERFTRGERALADERGDRGRSRQCQVGEAPRRPPLTRAVAVDHVGDVGRLGAEQPVEDERDGPRIATAVAPQVQHHAAGSPQQRERGLEVGRGDVHAVEAVEREHAHAVGQPPDLADRAGPRRDLARILRRPAQRLAIGDERSVGDVLEREVP